VAARGSQPGFIDAPIGQVAATEHARFWVPAPGVLTIALWGHVGLSDFHGFARLAPSWLGSDGPGRRSMVDLRRLHSVEPDAALAFATYIRANRDAYVRSLSACALLVQPHVVPIAAFIAGMPTLLGVESPCRPFPDPAAAVAWLGLPAGIADEHERLLTASADAEELLEALTAQIRARWTGIDLPLAAMNLGMSERTLQRRLAELGTSFRREVERARVTEAKRLLITTDDKVEVVAAAVGLGKDQQLATLFRRWTGMTPATWRATQR
jgi:AraC-like DNA-binding protein